MAAGGVAGGEKGWAGLADWAKPTAGFNPENPCDSAGNGAVDGARSGDKPTETAIKAAFMLII